MRWNSVYPGTGTSFVYEPWAVTKFVIDSIHVDELLPSGTFAPGTIPYWLPMADKNRNAITNRLEPNRSPSAVKYGMAELSGSIFHFHMVWIMTWAMYNREQICNGEQQNAQH